VNSHGVTPLDAPLARFGVAASFEGDLALLGLRGEIDASSARVVGAFFEALAASGYPSVVLDIAELDSLDAAGLAVVASAAGTLVGAGGGLTIRSSSTDVARVLDITWLSDLIGIELSPGRNHLGPEQERRLSAPPPGLGQAGSAEDPMTVTAIPTNEDVVDSALGLVVALARATVGGADGASVTLRRHGRLATVAASDQTILDMDADQYATGEGPCVDAAIEGRWFHAESLEAEPRWPAFTPKARALGISAILSSPLLVRDRPVGALNMYSRTATAFEIEDQKLAGVFATEASNVLAAAGVDIADDQLAGRFRLALRTREIIAEAQGVIMEREDIGDKEAFDVLRRSSGLSGKPLREEARDVIGSTHRPDSGTEIRSPERHHD
jgi:anti-anti-sigma factor